MSTADPWAVLGLEPGASVADARSARRSLAKELHPDLYRGDSAHARAELSARMTLVNRALADIEQQGERRPAPPARGDPDDDSHPAAEVGDPDTFSVASLPVEAFEALFLVSYGLGDILVADEPYLLELYLTEPAPCFCRLTLVPEAGGSIVTLEVSPPADGDAPTTEAVREVLVAELNRLVDHRGPTRLESTQ